MKPLSSFDELTDNVLLIIKLRELYVDIEALELPVGKYETIIMHSTLFMRLLIMIKSGNTVGQLHANLSTA